MKNKRRKKILLVLVEGITDQASLELILTNLASNSHKLILQVTYGDVTSLYTSTPQNIRSKINELIKSDGKKHLPSDYQEIIHIIDLDGVYLSHDRIIEDLTLNSLEYHSNEIRAPDINDVIKRNERKKEIINKLITTKFIRRSIPYRLFYFSCNLEHVLHDVMFVEDKDKIKLANKFEDSYYDNLDKFLDFMCFSDFSSKQNYLESWDEIKLINAFIPRKTNLDVFLKDYFVE